MPGTYFDYSVPGRYLDYSIGILIYSIATKTIMPLVLSPVCEQPDRGIHRIMLRPCRTYIRLLCIATTVLVVLMGHQPLYG